MPTDHAFSGLQPRILHTMLRVGDMRRSVEFYTRILGMRVLRTLDQPSERYTLTFLGYGPESTTGVLELTCNYGISRYEIGDAYGHIAIGVTDCRHACAAIKARGGRITYGPSPLKGSNEVIAFAVDPDGYQIELIERSEPRPPQ